MRKKEFKNAADVYEKTGLILEELKIKTEYGTIPLCIAAGDTFDIGIGKLRIKGEVFPFEEEKK